MNKASEFITVACAVLGAFSALPAAADPPSARIDPCTLVTAAEAAAALGVPVIAPNAVDDGLFRHCVYAGVDKRHFLYVDARDVDQADFQSGMKAGRRGLPVDPSMGADAYTDKSSGTLFVWKKGVVLNVLINDQSANASDAKLLEAEQQIAKIALRRF